jgi:hypothetical protein
VAGEDQDRVTLGGVIERHDLRLGDGRQRREIEVRQSFVRARIGFCAMAIAPTAATFGHIATARHHDEELTKTKAVVKAGAKRPGWVGLTLATLRDSGSDPGRR